MKAVNKIIKNKCLNKSIKFRYYNLQNKHHGYTITNYFHYLLFNKKFYYFCFDDINYKNINNEKIKSNYNVKYTYINHKGEKINKYNIYEDYK